MQPAQPTAASPNTVALPTLAGLLEPLLDAAGFGAQLAKALSTDTPGPETAQPDAAVLPPDQQPQPDQARKNQPTGILPLPFSVEPEPTTDKPEPRTGKTLAQPPRRTASVAANADV